METQPRLRVRDKNGVEALITGDIVDPRRLLILLRDGSKMLVPREALREEEDGYSVGFSFEGLEMLPPSDGEVVGVPVQRERLDVERSTRLREHVRLAKRVETWDEKVEEPIQVDDVEIERVQKNEIVDAPIAPTVDGDLTIVPLYEEILVVEKKLLLREEVHVRKVRKSETFRQVETLRAEYAEISRDE